jgi:hypothetical protein
VTQSDAQIRDALQADGKYFELLEVCMRIRLAITYLNGADSGRAALWVYLNTICLKQ